MVISALSLPGFIAFLSMTFSFMHLLKPMAMLWLFIKPQFGLKMSHLQRERKAWVIDKIWENWHCLFVLPVVLGYIIWVSFLWPWCVSVPPNVRGVGWRRGATKGKPSGEIRALSLFVWFNITLVYPWMDAKTFEFRAKERATDG